MLEGFNAWLEGTPLTGLFSDTTHFQTWLIIPVSQCIHLLSIAVLLISVGTLNLKLLGLTGRGQSFAQLASDLMPWIWTSLIVLFLTGTVQTIAEPGRELLNIGFRTKMILLAMAVAITLIFESTVKRDPRYWEHSPERRNMARLLATVSLVLWIGIAAAGRLIAYLDMRHS
jgi:hypothetical protein